MSALGNFCNLLIQFFEDLSESYPEEKDIKMATSALSLMKQANPRLVHTVFMQQVHKKFKDAIMSEDEEFILNRAREVLNAEYAEISYAFVIFDRHWSVMSSGNRQQIWKYLKSLIILAEKASASV